MMPQIYFELLKKSDPTALKSIHAKYNRRIFWLGKRFIDDEFVVENLMQDTFLQLWLYREKIESPMHILFFLQFVMKRSCKSYYFQPRNKFLQTMNSLENYENYQEYMGGFDPEERMDNLLDQESQQNLFDLLNRALPLIKPERRHLIDLCLKYGFHYKDIGQAMGMGVKKTVNEIQRAIEDIKSIVDTQTVWERKRRKNTSNLLDTMLSERQSQVLQLRCDKNCSFEAIANQLNLPIKEVHKEFMTAYNLAQQQQMRAG